MKEVSIGKKHKLKSVDDLCRWIKKETGTDLLPWAIAAGLRDVGLGIDSTEQEIRKWFPDLQKNWKPRRQILNDLSIVTGLSPRTVENYLGKRRLNPRLEADIQKFMALHGSAKAMSTPDRLGLRRKAMERRNILWQPDALPGDPPVHGKQWEFMESPEDWVLVEGGKGCIAAETEIDGVPVAEWRAGSVDTLYGRMPAFNPFLKGFAPLYRVTSLSGRQIVVTLQHRFLTPTGWRQLQDLSSGDLIALCGNEYDPAEKGIKVDSLGYYCEDSRHDDELPSPLVADIQDKLRLFHKTVCDNNARLSPCVVERSYSDGFVKISADGREDAMLFPRVEDVCGLTRQPSRLSLQDVEQCLGASSLLGTFGLGLGYQIDSFGHRDSRRQPLHTKKQGPAYSQHAQRPALGLDRMSKAPLSNVDQILTSLFPSRHKLAKFEEIVKVEYVRDGEFYDLTVPSAHHYFANGFVNHNSGKSDMLIYDCLRPEKITNKEWLGVIFRREYKRLVELIDRAHRIFAQMPDLKAHWQGGDSRFIFPSGARLAFHNCENDGDEEKYQGWQICDLKFDQLEEMDEKQFDFLILQNRSGDPLNLRSTMRATANPGGRGHAWVKRRLVDQKPEGQTHYIRSDNPMLGEDYVKTYRRIHATVFDNPLLKHDRAYIATLATHPDPIKRKAMLEGDWSIVIGQFFTTFATPVHVLPSTNAAGHPINLDKSFERTAGLDYGNVKVMEFLARDYEGNIYVEHECRTQPSTYKTGGLTASEFAEVTAEFMLSRGLGDGLMVTADTNMWIALGRDVDVDKVPANIVQDIWTKVFRQRDPNFRVPQLIPVSKKKAGETGYRIACNEAVKDYLDYQIEADGKISRPPRLHFFDRCSSIIITLPNLQTDPTDTMDIMDGQDDHDYDAMKMPFMSIYKPRPAPRSMTAKEIWDMQYAREHHLSYDGAPALIDARSDF
jgi:hypothetical protein